MGMAKKTPEQKRAEYLRAKQKRANLPPEELAAWKAKCVAQQTAYRKRHPEKAQEMARRASANQQKRLREDPTARERTRANMRAFLQKRRKRIIDRLGGRCAVCGFDDIRALQIDHVHGNGAEHRRRTPNSYAYYKEIEAEADSGAYQVLCANHNQIKKAECNETSLGTPRPAKGQGRKARRKWSAGTELDTSSVPASPIGEPPE